MQEVRRAERIKSFLRAQIIFNNRMSTMECTIKNFSPYGAKLALDESMSVPSDFDLYIPQKSRTYHAHMAWRDATAIGVEFVLPEDQDATTALTAVDIHAPSHEHLERIRALEIQNAELKMRLRQLSKRLLDLGQDPNVDADINSGF